MENSALPKVNMPAQSKSAKIICGYVELGVFLTLICNFLILLGNSQDITILVSWPTRFMVSDIFLLGCVLFINSIASHKVGIIDAWFAALVAYSAFCFIMAGQLGQYVSYMCFMMLPACMVLYRRVLNVRRVRLAVYVANTCYAILFILLSRASNSHYFQGPYGITIIEELTLGFNNPNESGIYLMLSFFVMLSAVFYWKKRWQRNGSIVLSVVLYYLLWQTQSRMAILMAAVAAVAVLMRRFYKPGIIMRMTVLLSPAISFVITMLFSAVLDSVSLMGEALDTGRYNIYQALLSRLDFLGVFIGNVPGFAGGNLHNSYLSIMGSYGLITTVLYIALSNAVLREQHANSQKSEAAYAAYIGILCIISHGIAEGTLLLSGTVYAGLGGLLFLLTLPEEKTV